MSPTAGTLGEVWRDHSLSRRDDTAIVHWVAGEAPLRWTWGNLVERATAYAAALMDRGVRKGSVCALIMRHHPEFYPLYMGIVYAGGIPSVLAYPNARLHPDKFRDGLSGMASRSGLDWILTEADLADSLLPLLAGNQIKVLYPLDWSIDAAAAEETQPEETQHRFPRPEPSEPAVLQHSSGTTGLQKGVMLSHQSILDHVFTYGDALDVTKGDCVVSWLPLYHDMGLIAAFHLPLTLGITSVQINPFEWVAAPSLLLEAIASEKGTLTWLPNFAYNILATRVHDDELEGVDLSSVRMFINCSEPVRSDSHQRFFERFQSFGVRMENLAACYAMAEATFAVTQTPPGQQARTLTLSAAELSGGQVVPAVGSQPSRICASSGIPIPGALIRIVNDSGEDAGIGTVGEIAVRSSSMFSGYRNSPEQTAAAVRDGWYFTGDYGFVDHGEYFIVGRKKDLIIVAGKNLFPEDIEAEVSAVDGIVPGRVVAFGVTNDATGTEEAWVLAETQAEAGTHDAIRRTVIRAAMAIDVTIARIILVPPRWLIKSSAGKLSRSANRERILEQLRTGSAA